MRKRILSLFLLLVMTLSLFACGAMNYADNDNSSSIGKGESDYGYADGDVTMDTTVSVDRKIIKTVNESVETEAYDDFIEKLKTAVSETEGYFVSSRYTGGVDAKGDRRASFEIRIPAEKLSDFTGKLGTLATVTSYQEDANDVTLSYVDVESRIAVLEAEEKALLEILANAGSTSELLEIRRSLSSTQSDLASLRAQKNSYDTLVAYSTVHLSVSEVDVARSDDTSFFGEVGNVFRACLSAVGRFFRAIGIFLLGASPILLLLAAIGASVYLIVRISVRKSAKRKANEANRTDKTDKTE